MKYKNIYNDIIVYQKYIGNPVQSEGGGVADENSNATSAREGLVHLKRNGN